ncbi:hypothetical protein GCM10023169_15660 [Georgenia halophila]|uniref:DUF4307 domain-containing protein n=1 Tax=Georgenia halophila TaxID=620889 RepID=A0ABP8L3D8_9MICO
MTHPAGAPGRRGPEPGAGSADATGGAASRGASGDPAIMAARYGRTRTGRRGIVVAAVVAVLLVGGGIGVQASNLGRPSVMTDSLGFTVQDATRTTVRFSVRTDPGTTVRCSVVALNETFTQVGFREVEIGPVAQQRTAHEVDVTTTELATTGGVEECTIIDAG